MEGEWGGKWGEVALWERLLRVPQRLSLQQRRQVGIRKEYGMKTMEGRMPATARRVRDNPNTRENKDMFFENKDAFGDSCHDMSQHIMVYNFL